MSIIHRIKRKLQTALTTDGMPDPPLNTALTTDAKPDPPRIVLEGPDSNSNISEAEIKQKSAPVTPDPQRIGEIVPVMRRPRSASAETTQNPEFPNAEDHLGFSESSKTQQRPRSPRTRANKPKSKTAASNGTVMNFTVSNSHHFSIGPQKKFIYNVNTKNVYNGSTSEDSTRRPKDKPMPRIVEELSTCKEVMSRDDMLLVKTHLGANWRDVARRLGNSEGQIDQFEEKYKFVDESIYQMLLDWERNNTSDAQVGKLISVIWDSQEYDCAVRLAMSHKTTT